MLSRVADNLYWMSRYLERAEHTSRLIAVNSNPRSNKPQKRRKSPGDEFVSALSWKELRARNPGRRL